MKKILSSLVMFSMVVLVAGAFASISIAEVNNHPTGTITVIKDTTGGNGTFNFHGTNGIGDFQITTTSDTGVHTFSNLPLGSYTITEGADQSNWSLDGGDNVPHCVYDNQAIREVVPRGDTVILNGEQDSATCTFHNTFTPPATVTINATKIICPVESDLPDWGDHSGPDITSTTATDFLNTHKDCHTAPWTFEWAPSGTSNPPGHDNQEVGGAGWTPFTGGTVTIPLPSGDNPYVWIREQMPTGYLLFSSKTTNLTDPASMNSAEMYCHVDHLNYDNYDRVDNMVAGGTYNCIGFNVPVNQCVPGEGTVLSDNTSTFTGQDGSGPAVPVTTPVNPGWTASIPGATWIWSTADAQNTAADNTETFTKTFTITGTPNAGSITIAADNTYDVSVNGHEIGSDLSGSTSTFQTAATFSIPAIDFVTGANTITIVAKNIGVKGSNAQSNPAGILYSLSWSSNCDQTPPPTDVCTNIEGNQSTLPAGDYFASAGICMPIVNGCTNDAATNFNPKATPGNPDAEQCTFPQNSCDVSPLTNGSFENGVAAGSFVTVNAGDNTSINNWTVDSGNVDYIGTYWPAINGSKSLDLNGSTTGSISQTFTTAIGQAYTVNFNLSGNPAGGPSLKDVKVTATGGVPTDFTYDTAAKGNTLTDMKWQPESYSFTATGTSTTLTFASQIEGAFGPALDNVSVACSVAPTTVKVTIDKFIDGVMATATSANSQSFPMTATWNATNIGSGSGSFNLSTTGFNSANAYEAITADMTSGANYSTNEVTGGSVVTSSCDNSGQPYSLVGYTTGDTFLAASTGTPSPTIPSFTGLTGNKFVIVWNHKCQTPNGGTPSANLSVTKTVNNHTPNVGDQITYTITVANAGPDSATGVTVSDLLPALTTWVSDDGAGAYNHTTGVWTIGAIANSASATLHITVSVNSGTAGDIISNTATVTNNNSSDPNPDNNSDSTSVTVNTPQNNPSTNGGSGGTTSGGGFIHPFGQVLGAQTSCGIYVDKFLRRGFHNNVDAVKKVQQFLDDFTKAGLVVDGNFGVNTEAALKAFQLAHKDKILDPWGILEPTGIFYLTTQTEVNNIMCPTLGLPIPSPLVNFTPNDIQ